MAWRDKARAAEDAVNTFFLLAMAALPVLEVVVRRMGQSLPGAIQYTSTLTLVVGFSGAVLASREGRHLALSLAETSLRPRFKRWAEAAAVATTTVVGLCLAWGAWRTIEAERLSTEMLAGGIPVWVPELVMPVGYAAMALRAWLRTEGSWARRVGVLVVILAATAGLSVASTETAELLWPWALMVLVAAALAGTPIFIALGGSALVLWWAADEPVAAVAAGTLQQLNFSVMPTIPLFTFAGYILAESGASRRLIRVFLSVFGWLPGGLAVMTALVCAFLTTFTGASGVTILALGGLLYPMLLKERYPERFSVGLLTASGSIGLLFMPSLPVIVYGMRAHVPIDRMFVAALVPGLLLVAAVSVLGIWVGRRADVPRHRFQFAEVVAATWAAKWELGLPFIVVGGLFLGAPVTAAALTVLYTVVVEFLVYRDLSIRKDLLRIGRDCSVLVGGVLVILGVAMGLTSYLSDAEVPMLALEWVRGGIESRWVFLLALNGFLIVVGCMMDIFSAIAVVVPLILPMGAHFGVDPVHLGVIFLANLELGFLTPPVGMNLFLASYRFSRPLPEVYRASLPFLLVLLVAVLVITYVPALTLWPVEWIFGASTAAPAIGL